MTTAERDEIQLGRMTSPDTQEDFLKVWNAVKEHMAFLEFFYERISWTNKWLKEWGKRHQGFIKEKLGTPAFFAAGAHCLALLPMLAKGYGRLVSESSLIDPKVPLPLAKGRPFNPTRSVLQTVLKFLRCGEEERQKWSQAFRILDLDDTLAPAVPWSKDEAAALVKKLKLKGWEADLVSERHGMKPKELAAKLSLDIGEPPAVQFSKVQDMLSLIFFEGIRGSTVNNTRMQAIVVMRSE